MNNQENNSFNSNINHDANTNMNNMGVNYNFNNNDNNNVGTSLNSVEEKMSQNGNANIEESPQNSPLKLIMYSIISLIVSIGTLYMASYTNCIYVLIVLPIYYLLGTLITKNKDFTLSMILGSMFGAVLLFVMSILKEDNEDLFTYLSIECVIVGIIGYILFSLLYIIVYDKKNAKGIHVLEFIILTGGLVYGMYYVVNNYPNYISKYLYCDKEIVANTEKDYIIETLKARYGIKFYCDEDLGTVKGNATPQEKEVTNLIDQSKRRITKRYCGDTQGNTFIVESIYYLTNKYVVFDEYANTLLLKKPKEILVEKIMGIEGINKVTISLYSKDKCHFIGECVDVEEYYENIENENSIEKQYQMNNDLILKKYIEYNQQDFVNEYGFKYQIKVEGIYNITDENYFNGYVERIMNVFNEENYKNTNGMEIIFYETSNSELKTKKAHFIVEKSENKKFENYKIK